MVNLLFLYAAISYAFTSETPTTEQRMSLPNKENETTHLRYMNVGKGLNELKCQRTNRKIYIAEIDHGVFEHTCYSAIFYDQSSALQVAQEILQGQRSPLALVRNNGVSDIRTDWD